MYANYVYSILIFNFPIVAMRWRVRYWLNPQSEQKFASIVWTNCGAFIQVHFDVHCVCFMLLNLYVRKWREEKFREKWREKKTRKGSLLAIELAEVSLTESNIDSKSFPSRNNINQTSNARCSCFPMCECWVGDRMEIISYAFSHLGSSLYRTDSDYGKHKVQLISVLYKIKTFSNLHNIMS